jgi:putative transposase
MHLPNRTSPRAQRYDYSSTGMYFITICTQNRQDRLSDVVEEKVVLKPA